MTSYLDDFQDEDRVRIIFMPVRIGFWMSRVDDIAGTDRDDEKETLALEKALQAVKSKTGEKSFTNDVVEYALQSEADWSSWAEGGDTMLSDLPRVLKLIGDMLPADALTGYKKALYYTATVVAQAAAETGVKEEGRSGIFGRLIDGLSVKTDMSVPGNISAAEKAALQKLVDILKA